MPKLPRLALSFLGLFALACSEERPPAAPAPPAGAPRAPIVLVGVDGGEWDVVLPLVRQGRLPVLAGLMQRGAYGRLETVEPTVSPLIWTTIATGVPPEQHGIEDFVRTVDGADRLYTNADRKAAAFWDALGAAGRTSFVVGWWMTFPVDPIRGVMVAQTNTLEQFDTRHARAVWKGTLLPGLAGQVHPPEFQAEALGIAASVERELPAVVLQSFGAFPHPPRSLEKRMWDNTLWALRADRVYFEVTQRLLKRGMPFDLLAVYFGGTDVVGHRFWRYRTPQEFAHPPDASAIESFGGVIDRYYEVVDGMIGEMLAKVRSDATVIVVSDHGMHAVNTDQAFDTEPMPENANSGAHPDAPPGLFIAAGPRVRPTHAPPPGRAAEVPEVASIYDLAPTLLALAGVPVGRDMKGEVRSDLFQIDESEVAFVASHTTEPWREARGELQQRAAQAAASERERLEQLRQLGYIR